MAFSFLEEWSPKSRQVIVPKQQRQLSNFDWFIGFSLSHRVSSLSLSFQLTHLLQQTYRNLIPPATPINLLNFNRFNYIKYPIEFQYLSFTDVRTQAESALLTLPSPYAPRSRPRFNQQKVWIFNLLN